MVPSVVLSYFYAYDANFYGLTPRCDARHRRDVLRHRDRGLALAIATGDQWSTIPYAQHLVARIDVALGDRDAAIETLQTILQKPYVISAAWLRIDPTWNSLRGDPRFEQIVASLAPKP